MWGAHQDTLTDFLIPVHSLAVWIDGNGFGARDLGWKLTPSTAHLNDLGQVLYFLGCGLKPILAIHRVALSR